MTSLELAEVYARKIALLKEMEEVLAHSRELFRQFLGVQEDQDNEDQYEEVDSETGTRYSKA